MNIEIISGSPRKDSVTHRIALHLLKLARQKTKHHIDIIDVREWELPLLQQETIDDIENAPVQLQPLAKRIFSANAFILITPEYNGSYTSALKTLFDLFPHQKRKAFGIVTASTGSMGGMRASQQLHLFINALLGIPSPFMLITPFVDKKFGTGGELLDPLFEKQVATFMGEFLWLSEKLAPL
ncbi:MAG: NAD(P)H-dependent oxidoreductase [Bacteroidetes bacterium]|nr:NAD(P)H-dependent oxidoreductase [Bacteroidota bacterium]